MNKFTACTSGLIILFSNCAIADSPTPDALTFCSSQNKNECVAAATEMKTGTDSPAFCDWVVTYISHDGMKTWKETGRTGCEYSNISHILHKLDCREDLQHCYLAGYENISFDYSDIFLMTSHDKGNHWNSQTISKGGLTGDGGTISDFYCNSSWSHCVAVGSFTQFYESWPLALYMEGNNMWGDVEIREKQGRWITLACSEKKDNVTCIATGVAVEGNQNRGKITAISTDSGKTWVYEPVLNLKHLG